MKCEDCLFCYDDFVDGELEAKVFSEVSEHLAICKSCDHSYKEFRLEQEIFERHLLKAKATPALWKNLQAAIKSEKIVPTTFPTTTISRKFREFFNNFGMVLSPRGLTFSGLAVVAACAIIFSLAGHKNNPVEYAGLNQKISPVSQLPESISNKSTAKSEIEKESYSGVQDKPLLKMTAKQFKAARIKHSIERVTTLPRKKRERKNSETTVARDESSKELLPGEKKYLEIINELSAEVKSIEPTMQKILSDEYQRNLSAVDKAIEETRKSARRHPKNQDVMNFVITAYQGKIALLSQVARR